MICTWNNLAPTPYDWYDFAFESGWLRWNELCRVPIVGSCAEKSYSFVRLSTTSVISGQSVQKTAFTSKVITQTTLSGSAYQSSDIVGDLSTISVIEGTSHQTHAVASNVSITVVMVGSSHELSNSLSDIAVQTLMTASISEMSAVVSEISLQVDLDPETLYQHQYSFSTLSSQLPLIVNVGESSYALADISTQISMDVACSQLSGATALVTSPKSVAASVPQATTVICDLSVSSWIVASVGQTTYVYADIDEDSYLSTIVTQRTFAVATMGELAPEIDLVGSAYQRTYMIGNLTEGIIGIDFVGSAIQSTYSEGLAENPGESIITGFAFQKHVVTAIVEIEDGSSLVASVTQWNYNNSILFDKDYHLLTASATQSTMSVTDIDGTGTFSSFVNQGTFIQAALSLGGGKLNTSVSQNSCVKWVLLDRCYLLTDDILTEAQNPEANLSSGPDDVWSQFSEVTWLGAPLFLDEQILIGTDPTYLISETDHVWSDVTAIQWYVTSFVEDIDTWRTQSVNVCDMSLIARVNQRTSTFLDSTSYLYLSAIVSQDTYISSLLETKNTYFFSRVYQWSNVVATLSADIGMIGNSTQVSTCIANMAEADPTHAVAYQTTSTFSLLESAADLIAISNQKTYTFSDLKEATFIISVVHQNSYGLAKYGVQVDIEAAITQSTYVISFVGRDSQFESSIGNLSYCVSDVDAVESIYLQTTSFQETHVIGELSYGIQETLITTIAQLTYTLSDLEVASDEQLLSIATQLTFAVAEIASVHPSTLISSVKQAAYISASLGDFDDIDSYSVQSTYLTVSLNSYEYISSNVFQSSFASGDVNGFGSLVSSSNQVTSGNSRLISIDDIFAIATQLTYVIASVSIGEPIGFGYTYQVTYANVDRLWDGIALTTILRQRTSSIGEIRATTLGWIGCPVIENYYEDVDHDGQVIVNHGSLCIEVYDDGHVYTIVAYDDGHDYTIENYCSSQ